MSEQDRDPSARRRLADRRARDAARQRRRRLLVVVLGSVAAAAAVIAVVVVAVSRGGGEPFADDYKGPLAPTTRLENGAVAMGRPGVETPVLEIYEDFQCPACRQLERRFGATFKELAAEGRAKVVYRPFQLFQQDPLMSNSRRAANAAACIPVGRWVPYHDRLFAEQPPEGEDGYAPEDLIEWGSDLGVTDPEFAACVNGGRRIAQVDKAGVAAGRAGVDATPYVALNGRRVAGDALESPDELKEAVARAGGGGAPPPAGTRSGGDASGAAGTSARQPT